MNNVTFFLALAMLMLCSTVTQGQIHKGPIIDGIMEEKLGLAVSMPDENTIAVAAATFNPWIMYVKVFEWNGNTWIQKGQNIEGEVNNEGFGESISMPDANTIAIGDPYNGANGDESGQVRIYEWDGAAWIQKGLNINGEDDDDNSGWSVSMPDANTVAIGAFRNGGNGTQAGHVRIYAWNGTAWMQKGIDLDGEAISDRFGFSISMPDANTVAIGAPYSDENGSETGHVKIYEWGAGVWNQKGIKIIGEEGSDRSGQSVSMPDANTVAIGAFRNDGNFSNSGHARIYEWNGTTWIQKGLDIDGVAADDWSGSAVSMPDANTVGIGAPLNDDGGGNSGHARIYGWNGTAWIQKGSDMDGEISNLRFGTRVCMPNANTIAAVTLLTTSPGSSTGNGYVRVYSLPVLVSSIAVQGTAGVSTISTYAGILQMEANVLPSNADDATYTWSVTNGTGAANISSNGLLAAVSNGTVTVTATANDASGITGTAEITISNQLLVNSITVQGAAGNTAISTAGGTLQMEANVLPANADNDTFTWSVDNGSGSAAIDATGLLTAMANGTVTVIATANDPSGVTGTADITISNQNVKVNEQGTFYKLSIYPNPVNSQIILDTETKIQAIKIIDSSGKTVKSIVEPIKTINVSGLAEGIYFLQIQIEETLITRKITKE